MRGFVISLLLLPFKAEIYAQQIIEYGIHISVDFNYETDMTLVKNL